MISQGTFDDIYVGDYIVANNIRWLVADIDNYLREGSPSLTQHHLTMIPASYLTTAAMSQSSSTENGYAGSDMVTKTLPNVFTEYIAPAFHEHVLTYGNLLVNSINMEANSMAGNGLVGSSKSSDWYERKLDLMSEMNVFGATIWSSSGYDTGIDNHQYALFQLKPEFKNSDGRTRISYYLKDVASSTYFTCVSGYGNTFGKYSSVSDGVRPRFLIG